MIPIAVVSPMAKAATTNYSVPFAYVRREIVVRVRVNGHGPYAMLLDTGTAPSVIDLRVAKEVGLKISNKGSQGSGGGTEKIESFETNLPLVQINGFSAKNIDSLATDLSGLSKQFGQQLDGVLGDSLFSNRIIQIDYAHRTATFFARSPVTGLRPGQVTIPFQHADDEVHFQGLRINGKSVVANLDTGSNSEFSLTPRGEKRLGIQGLIQKSRRVKAAGFNGAYSSRDGTLKSAQLMRFRFNQPSATFWDPGTGHDDRNWDVNVGNRFLERFVVTLDYRNQLVTFLRPRKKRLPNPK